jgi:hypothetical protein
MIICSPVRGVDDVADGPTGRVNYAFNLRSGKGPDFGHAIGTGTRKGMTGAARSNHPGRDNPVD